MDDGDVTVGKALMVIGALIALCPVRDEKAAGFLLGFGIGMILCGALEVGIDKLFIHLRS